MKTECYCTVFFFYRTGRKFESHTSMSTYADFRVFEPPLLQYERLPGDRCVYQPEIVTPKCGIH